MVETMDDAVSAARETSYRIKIVTLMEISLHREVQ